MRTLDADDPNYIRALERLEREHKTARDLGLVDATGWQYSFDRVLLELKLITSLEVALKVAEFSVGWVQTRNPHYMDLALMQCIDSGVCPSPHLTELLTEATKLRFLGSPRGTSKRVKKKYAIESTFLFMANCCFHEQSLPKAALKAVTWFKNAYPNLKPPSHTSLEKKYPVIYRQPTERGTTREQELFSRWKAYKSPDDNEWKDIIGLIPEADIPPSEPSRH